LNTNELVARRDSLFGAGAPLFYNSPVHLVRGEGVWLYDADGRQYLDMYNNIPVVGHCNPRVVEALAKQASTLNIHSRYIATSVLDYAEKILSVHASHLNNVVFACTGTEANEIAMQMAKIVTGGEGFICTDATYHGHSDLVGSLTYSPRRGRKNVNSFAFPNMYRPLVDGVTEEDLCNLYLAEVQSAIDDFAAEGIKLAGIIMCSLFANEGLPTVPKGFMKRAAEMVRAAGGVVILDEVQAGFCRSGKWWGYEVMETEPDIVTMGKPMGNGIPLAGCVARSKYVEMFRAQKRYFNTFASSPIQAACGMAVIEEIESCGLPAQITSVGAYLRDEILKLAPLSPHIGDVRGVGLFISVEWVKDRESKVADTEGAAAIANILRDRGILLSNAGAMGNVLKIRPPLVFEKQHADYFLNIFKEVLLAEHD